MTTEKEFWASAGRYFRTLTSIQTVIDELHEDSALPKDMRAIKSMKRIENIMKASGKPDDPSINISCIIEGRKEPIIDEGCVGCCKVVDVAAGLQEELDDARGIIMSKDRVLVNLHKTIKDFKTIEIKETDRLHAIIDDQSKTIHYLKQEIVGRKDQLMEQREVTEFREREILRFIEELKDRTSEGLHELYKLDKEERDRLKAELSARKQDSEVLKKVVDVANRWSDERIASRPAMNQIAYIVKDYHDVHEEPEDTTIDEPHETTATFVFLELP